MKALLVAAAVLLVILATAPAVAASGPAPSAPAAVDPTSIQAVTPSALVAGIETTLVASIRDTATSQPVGGANLSFTEKTTFGWLLLGNVTTNALGEGGVRFAPVANGTYSIVVSYAGDGSYAPSNTTLSLTVLAAYTPPPPAVPADRLIVLVIVAVIGGVWATYGFIGYLILGIRGAGSRPEDDAFESEETESMEEQESDKNVSKKRVPGAANANKAVAYLAISALILSGAAVALLVTGGVGKSSGYVPATVSLQVTVVPDFRGAGWDSFVPDELVAHAGDTVKITVYNEDTMDHGFAIDAIGVNQVLPAASQDNVTGDITPTATLITFTVPTAGAFIWYCTNPCGDGHQTMTGTLLVLLDD